MENLIWILPALACPIGMILMMFVMGKGMGMGRKRDTDATQPSVDELRAEQQRLGAQIESLERGNGELASESARTRSTAGRN
jgi:hypothetical protein